MSKRADHDHPIHELIAGRWSPYSFTDRPIERADLLALFEAARWAPSSYNEQPWRFVVARRDDRGFDEILSCLVEANQAWAKHAAALAIGVVSRRFARNDKPNAAAEHDLGLAVANLSVEATARGIAVHQMIGILPDRAREQFAIPQDHDALTGLALGYAGARPDLPDPLLQRDDAPRARRPLPEFVFGARFGEPAPLLTE